MVSVIFGASSFGATAYHHLKSKFDIRFFCDNAIEKQGTTFEGLEVLSPSALSGKNIIIASMYNLEIAHQLVEMGIQSFYSVNDCESGTIKTTYVDLSIYPPLSVNYQKICCLCENHSGSNAYAMSKLVTDNEYIIATIFENNKNTAYYYHVFTSGIVMMTYERSPLQNKINIQLWHGIPLKSLGYMNKLRLKFSEMRHTTWSKFDAVISYSTMYSVLMGACYGLKRDKIYTTGVPRNDFLFVSDGKKNLLQIFDGIEEKKVILYAPTFREDVHGFQNGSSDAYIYNWVDTDIHVLDNFLSQNNCILVMKLHTVDINNFNQLPNNLSSIKTLSDNMISENNFDFYELLNAFDILITDYSSIYFDYLLLNRPIIFTPKDLEEYSQDIGLLLEPYDFWTPGAKVTDMEALKCEITKALTGDDAYRSKRKEITDIFHTYQDGNSSKRIMDTIQTIVEQKNNPL